MLKEAWRETPRRRCWLTAIVILQSAEPPTAPSDVASERGRIQQQDRALYASKSCVAMSIRLFSAACMLLARASLCKCGSTTEKRTHRVGWLETGYPQPSLLERTNTNSKTQCAEKWCINIHCDEKREVPMTTNSIFQHYGFMQFTGTKGEKQIHHRF